ncbi:MAG TPA: pyridoxamine 5'-phosphate oxidase family protein, partial [Thermomicrobiales bacterium]|nr:pyridoxamine 5'-phosphate oxidase family protein [Thermomicrobiales bacterium]
MTAAVEQKDETGEGWRGKIGLMDRQEMDEFLAAGNLARLAVLDDNGWPYVQPVWYQWEPTEGVFLDRRPQAERL